jgi:spore maturation protein SpmB
MSSIPFSSGASSARPDFLGMALAWAISTGLLALKIVAIVLSVMIVQRLLEEFKAMDFLSRIFAPIMRLFGLPGEASFLWIVINIVGYAYGAGIVESQVKDGKMKNQEADLFNHHASLCHSLFEDTTLFLAVGIPLFWITVPRFIMAFLAVWIERGRRRFLRRSFRVGTD